jgi:hypothetical protein
MTELTLANPLPLIHVSTSASPDFTCNARFPYSNFCSPSATRHVITHKCPTFEEAQHLANLSAGVLLGKHAVSRCITMSMFSCGAPFSQAEPVLVQHIARHTFKEHGRGPAAQQHGTQNGQQARDALVEMQNFGCITCMYALSSSTRNLCTSETSPCCPELCEPSPRPHAAG